MLCGGVLVCPLYHLCCVVLCYVMPSIGSVCVCYSCVIVVLALYRICVCVCVCYSCVIVVLALYGICLLGSTSSEHWPCVRIPPVTRAPIQDQTLHFLSCYTSLFCSFCSCCWWWWCCSIYHLSHLNNQIVFPLSFVAVVLGWCKSATLFALFVVVIARLPIVMTTLIYGLRGHLHFSLS